jgi:hypothetical protein
MAKSRRGGQGAKVDGGSISQSHTGIVLNTTGTSIPSPVQTVRNHTQFTDADATKLIAQNADAYQDPDFVYARKLYVSAATDSSGFSFSQNLNYKMDNNIPLNANEQFMKDMLQGGMRPIGKDTMLFRAAHDDILKSLGIKDYTKMSQAQLQQQLVGTTMQTTSYTSWSYDKSKNPFLPGQLNGGGREVYIVNKAGASTNMFFGAKSQAEVVTNIGTNLKISNVYFDGTYATPRLKGAKVPRIVIEVESW